MDPMSFKYGMLLPRVLAVVVYLYQFDTRRMRKCYVRPCSLPQLPPTPSMSLARVKQAQIKKKGASCFIFAWFLSSAYVVIVFCLPAVLRYSFQSLILFVQPSRKVTQKSILISPLWIIPQILAACLCISLLHHIIMIRTLYSIQLARLPLLWCNFCEFLDIQCDLVGGL